MKRWWQAYEKAIHPSANLPANRFHGHPSLAPPGSSCSSLRWFPGWKELFFPFFLHSSIFPKVHYHYVQSLLTKSQRHSEVDNIWGEKEGEEGNKKNEQTVGNGKRKKDK